MLDIGKYIPDSVKNWMAKPVAEKPKNQEEEKQQPVQVAEYVRKNPDGSERRVRLMKTTTERLSPHAIREKFIIEADVGTEADGSKKFEQIGSRSAEFNAQQRYVEFDVTKIFEQHRGGGLGTDSYKAFIQYANERAQDIDEKNNRQSTEAWDVVTVPLNPITEYQFKKFFHAQMEGNGMLMRGKLRSLEEIEAEEQSQMQKAA